MTCLARFGSDRRALCAALLLATAPLTGAQSNSPSQDPSGSPTEAQADPIPVMLPHPESDRIWLSGQANFISQWHPAFSSPYQGPNSLAPEAQDASSRVLTLFTGLRLSKTSEILCDIQETGGTASAKPSDSPASQILTWYG